MAPLEGNAIMEYARQESGGGTSVLVVRRQVCECQPEEMSDELQRLLGQLPGTVVKRDTATVCGQAASHLTVTGVAGTAPGRKNFVLFAFRSGDALVTQQYTFVQPQPAPDAVATLQSLCPSG